MLRWFLHTAVLFATVSTATAQTATQPAQDAKPSMEVYGFTMLDMGHDFTSINPNWFDTMRVTRLPSFDKEFGEDQQPLRRRDGRAGSACGRRCQPISAT